MPQLPFELVVALSSSLGLKTAVETGTYSGTGAELLKSLFPRVFSVELSEALYLEAKEKYGNIKGLEFIWGSSPVVLPEIMQKVGEPALFWLDAHWSPDFEKQVLVDPRNPTLGWNPEETSERLASVGGQCPVLDEIQAIDRYEFNSESCILIDDARLFLGPPPPPHRRDDWPTFLEIVDLLRQSYPRFVTVLNDVIVAGPPRVQAVLDEYWLGVLARGTDQVARLFNAETPTVTTAAKKLVRAIAFALMPERAGRVSQRLRARRDRESTNRVLRERTRR
jgi:hypothetical protein